MALLPGSPAIDAGDPNVVDPPEWDQRGPGFPRIVNGRIDIGSFEVQSTGAPPQAPVLVPLTNANSEAPKGRNMPAQGNALGECRSTDAALKGRHSAPADIPVVAPLQGLVDGRSSVPRALPWADVLDPFGVENDTLS
jgi:hypothetical protein